MDATGRTWLVIGIVVALCLGIVGGATALVRAHPPVDAPSIDRRPDAVGVLVEESDRRRALAVPMPVFFVGSSGGRPYLYREEVLTRTTGDDMLTEAVRTLLEGGTRDPDHRLSVPLDAVEVETGDGRPVVRLRGDLADADPAEPRTGLLAQAVVHTVTAARALNTGVEFEVNDGAASTLFGVDVSGALHRQEGLEAPVLIRVPSYGAIVPPGSLVQGDSDLRGGEITWTLRGGGLSLGGTTTVRDDGRFEFPIGTARGEYLVEVTAVVDGEAVTDTQAFEVS